MPDFWKQFAYRRISRAATTGKNNSFTFYSYEQTLPNIASIYHTWSLNLGYFLKKSKKSKKIKDNCWVIKNSHFQNILERFYKILSVLQQCSLHKTSSHKHFHPLVWLPQFVHRVFHLLSIYIVPVNLTEFSIYSFSSYNLKSTSATI